MPLICLQHFVPAGLPPQRGKLPFIWFDHVLRGTGPLLPVPILLLRWYATLPLAGADATAGPAMLELLVQIPPFTVPRMKYRSAVGQRKVAPAYAASTSSRRAPSVNTGAYCCRRSCTRASPSAGSGCMRCTCWWRPSCVRPREYSTGNALPVPAVLSVVVLQPTHGNAGDTCCCLDTWTQRIKPIKF
jgi:hypothetical protein